MTLPDEDSPDLQTSMSWRYGFAAPGILALVSSLMWLFLIRVDSLAFLIDEEREDQAFNLFRRIYKFNSAQSMDDDWELIKHRRGLERSVKELEDKPSTISILTNRKYRAGSIFLIFGAVIA